MTMSDNKRILQHVFAETAKGNGRPFVAALSEGVVWTIIGSTQWSGTYRGKQAVLRDLLGPLNAQLAGRNTITAERFTAEDDRVVVEGQGHNTTKAGRQYNNRYCWVFRFSQGQVVELIEYTDTALIESALQPPSAALGASQAES
jgi:ketosteroid isomerase-like protein